MHSIEFLTEATAKSDTDYPERNIIGISDVSDPRLRDKAQEVLDILPQAHFESIVSYEEASLIKYGGNCYFYVKNIFFNLLYDLAESHGCDWRKVHQGIIADSRIHPVHTYPVHKGGRGAGGHCMVKDFAAFREEYKKEIGGDSEGIRVLNAIEEKNITLLGESQKDIDILNGVYG